MDYFRRFTFLFAAPVFDTDDLEGLRFNQIVAEIERSGFEVVRARKLEDAEIAVQTDAAIGCMVVDWGKKGLEGKTAALIILMRRRGLDFPIILLIRRKRFEDLPVEVLDFIDGYVFLSEETPAFIAKNLISRLKQFAETLKTPFFGALVDYAEEGNQLWTCPGHNGGVFYSRSPIGRVFVEHLGEAVFRDDLDNSVLDLGDLLTHEGPALKAQKEAAQIFGAEKTYFVLNGTSTSNKVALGALVTDGDLVLFDRNNHKAAHHGALMIAGGIPVYIPTVRNAWGLIGPMRWDALDETALRERIRSHPLVKDAEAWRKPRPFRVAVVEECTYDGTIHSAEMILKRIGHLCDYILFDEAWAGFMKFHPLYAGRFAMGLSGLDGEAPGVIATQSTHKQLARRFPSSLVNDHRSESLPDHRFGTAYHLIDDAGGAHQSLGLTDRFTGQQAHLFEVTCELRSWRKSAKPLHGKLLSIKTGLTNHRKLRIRNDLVWRRIVTPFPFPHDAVAQPASRSIGEFRTEDQVASRIPDAGSNDPVLVLRMGIGLEARE